MSKTRVQAMLERLDRHTCANWKNCTGGCKTMGHAAKLIRDLTRG